VFPQKTPHHLLGLLSNPFCDHRHPGLFQQNQITLSARFTSVKFDFSTFNNKAPHIGLILTLFGGRHDFSRRSICVIVIT
jgi:hypothetical protein